MLVGELKASNAKRAKIINNSKALKQNDYIIRDQDVDAFQSQKNVQDLKRSILLQKMSNYSKGLIGKTSKSRRYKLENPQADLVKAKRDQKLDDTVRGALAVKVD